MITAQKADIDALLALYGDRTIRFGDLHNHTDSGPTADGRMTLVQWKEEMKRLGMSFAAIVDHKQVAHMYHKDWQNQATEEFDTVFIGGSEPGTSILDSKAEQRSMHYNMLLNDPEKLLDIVRNNGKFCVKSGRYETFNWNKSFGCTNKVGTYDPADYAADPSGILETWTYPKFTTEEFGALANAIYEAGGLLVHVHPKYSSYLISDDPLDYWFADWTGLEVVSTYHATRDDERTQKNYDLWVNLLALGKKVWATAGNDEHDMPSVKSLSTVYSTDKHAEAYFDQVRVGNFTVGPVGIRMCVGNTQMGSEGSFTGQRVVFSVGDFHQSVYEHDHTYRVDLISNEGVVFSQEISCDA